MAARWVIAFSLAAWLAVVGCATIRRLARAQRTERDSEAKQLRLRRLGGPVLAVATLAGWLASPSLPARLGVAAAAAAAVAFFGLIEDRRTLPGFAHLVMFAAAAAVVAAAGIRVDQLRSDALDTVLTVIWIVIVTSAFRRLDHVEGLTAATAAVAGAGLFGVAAATHDNLTATMCVALAGGCLGILVYNARPASIVPGFSGASFAGFVLATAGVAFKPDTVTPGGLVVPLLIVAVPVLDLAVVTASRLWRGVPLGRPRRDHLVHRLRARGWSRALAMGALLGAQSLLTIVALLVGRGDLSPAWGLLLGAGVAGALVVRSLEVSTTPGHRPRPRTRGRLVLGLALAALGIIGALSAVAVWEGLRDVRSAQAAFHTALAAGRRGDTAAAEAAFADAATSFDRADTWLDSPLGWPGRGIPFVAENLRAARELAGGGADISRAGRQLAHASNRRLQVGNGTVRIDEVRRLTPDVEAATKLLHQVARRIEDLRRPYLLAPVRDRVDKAETELRSAAREADNGVAAAKVTPAVFGADRPRRYFLAVQNNAELRATGGLIGSWGILTAENGKVTLDQIQRTNLLNEPGGSPRQSSRHLDAPPEFLQRYGPFAPAQVWQNLNMSPDFPTVGSLIANLYPQSGGTPVDGVIAVDPVGLQALLRLTGTVVVQGWPVPITADNVVDVTLRQAYDAFGNGQRVEFLGDVAEAVWKRATQMNLGSPAHLARILGDTGRQGHLQLWFADPNEEALAVRLGVGGAVPPVRSDSLLITNQNSSGNKVDFYLTRHVDYTMQLDPDASVRRARAKGTLELRLDNGAPAGPPSIALGPFDQRFQPGENRSFVSIYSPLSFRNATLDGRPTELEAATELHRNVFSNFTSVPAGSSRTLKMQLDGTIPLGPGGWYTLELPRQPTIRPDDVSVNVEVPPGWRIAEAQGLEIMSPRRAEGKIALDDTRQVRVKLAPDHT